MKLLLFLYAISLMAYAVPEEETEALRAMRLSCEKQKVALGCFNYANMLVRNDRADQAEKYFELGCKQGLEQSCSKEKWDLPERKETPEIVVLPEAPAPTEEENGESGDATPANVLPSRVSVRESETESSEPKQDSSSYEAPAPIPSPAPASQPEPQSAQSEESSGPTEDLNSLTPSEGNETAPSVSE